MSHEIRTPLGVILGFVELIKESPLSPEQQAEYFEIVQRNGQKLSKLINDVLDLSKVEAGCITPEKTNVELLDLIEDIVTSLEVKAGDKGIKLVTIFSAKAPKNIISDPHRLRQILLNLTDNAIKFTNHGEVKIEVGMLGDLCSFQISDTGVGISPQQQKQLFRPFSQGDNSMTRKYGGTGLGLHLSRYLAQALGGDTVLKRSELGKGTTFLVTVATGTELERKEIAEIASTSIRGKTEGALTGVKILLAEDSHDNQFLIKRMLSNYGAEIDLAENGMVAIEKALQGQYDVVLLDIQMPVLDGLSTFEQLKQRGYPKPVIAITAHAMQTDREKYHEAGFRDFIAKPVVLDNLISTITRHL